MSRWYRLGAWVVGCVSGSFITTSDFSLLATLGIAAVGYIVFSVLWGLGHDASK